MVVSEATTIPPSGNGSFNQQASYGHSWLWMTYGTDNMLRYSQKSWYDVSGKRSIFTEYRYDALGRRVLTRARRDTLCTRQSEWKCLSTVDRFMWDGDQIVAEFRVPGADSLSEDALQGTFAPGDLYGRVRYTHAHGIDEPIAVWNGNVINSGIVPHASWRGQFEAGSEIQTGALLENGSPPWEWPARYRDVNLAPEIRQPIPDPTRWLGSLIEGQVELSGLAYRRNRYYNPATGRFTQEDPIGLAGGLNLYGYADGDPVNLSDPFGLSPCCAIHPGSITQSISGAIERDPLTITVNDREAMVDGLIMAATGGGGRLVGQVGSGLRAATGGLRSLFSGGTVSGRTIIGVRASLLKSGFTQGLSKNRKGYLFVNEAGEQVRIMRKAGEWEIRVRNRAGNWLDDLGNSARDRASSHDIKLINK
jgi:RHS repeat-associated protein